MAPNWTPNFRKMTLMTPLGVKSQVWSWVSLGPPNAPNGPPYGSSCCSYRGQDIMVNIRFNGKWGSRMTPQMGVKRGPRPPTLLGWYFGSIWDPQPGGSQKPLFCWCRKIRDPNILDVNMFIFRDKMLYEPHRNNFIT